MSNAAEEAIVPFLGQIMEHLKVYLTAPDTEDGITLKTQAIDTLSVFARKIGEFSVWCRRHLTDLTHIINILKSHL